MTIGSRLDITIDTTVEFTFIISNDGQDPIELKFPSGLAVDFVVCQDGTEVWRWSDGRMFTQAIESTTLSPGESVSYTGRWHNPDPGEWTAVATLEAVNVSLKATSSFQV